MVNKEFWKGFVEGFLKGVILLAMGYAIGYSYCFFKELKPLEERNNFKKELIIQYEVYYNAVESALDTLEHHDNWVDRFDFPDYYDSRAKLDSLYISEE